MPIPLEIGFKTPGGTVTSLSTLSPGEDFCVPVVVSYQGIWTRPAGLAYNWSDTAVSIAKCLPCQAFVLAAVATNFSPTILRQTSCFGGHKQTCLCSPNVSVSSQSAEDDVAYLADSDTPGPQFQLQALVTQERFDGVAVNARHPHHVATFVAPVALRNLLPHSLTVDVSTPNSTQPQVSKITCQSNTLRLFAAVNLAAKIYSNAIAVQILAVIEPGELIPLFRPPEKADRLRISCSAWAAEAWSEPTRMDKKCMIILKNQNGDELELQIRVQVGLQGPGTTLISVFSPYWIVNKTGVDVSLRQQGDNDEGPSVVLCPAADQNPVMFAYPCSGLTYRDKARVILDRITFAESRAIDRSLAQSSSMSNVIFSLASSRRFVSGRANGLKHSILMLLATSG